MKCNHLRNVVIAAGEKCPLQLVLAPAEEGRDGDQHRVGPHDQDDDGCLPSSQFCTCQPFHNDIVPRNMQAGQISCRVKQF